ncbi:MAG: tail fiber domain-containing protein [Sedimentisphaerales bacterium]|nr:tail fiber domain-containing protein [Sedimentisphaerales bacterium]
MSMHRLRMSVVVAAALVGTAAVWADPMGTAFTYQGQLKKDGIPVSGPSVNLVITLWDTAGTGCPPAGGTQLGVQTLSGVPVTNGLFMVKLDFGSGPFQGQARWLEIAVDGTTLCQRQELAPAPYALYSANAPWSGLLGMPAGFADGVDNDTQYSAGAGLTLAGTVLSIADGGVTNAKLAASVVTTDKIVDGSVTTADLANASVTPAKVAGGTASGQVLMYNGAAVVWQALPSGFWAANGTDIYNSNAGRVGIGTSTPGHKLEVQASGPQDAVAGFADTAGYAAVYGEMSAGLTSPLQEAWGVKGTNTTGGITGALAYGKSVTGPPTFYAVYGEASSSDYAGYFAGRVQTTGNLGVGRSAVTNKLEVEGNASKTTAGSWLANSDRRIKTDVKPVSNALEKLDKVRLVDFRYTDEYRKAHPSIEDQRYVNVIAQEYAEVFPDHVTSGGETLPDGSKILQTDSYPLTIYAAAGVQELHKALEEKDAQIADLTSRLERLEALLAKLVDSQEVGR